MAIVKNDKKCKIDSKVEKKVQIEDYSNARMDFYPFHCNKLTMHFLSQQEIIRNCLNEKEST